MSNPSTDMNVTEWTPERRKEREQKRELARTVLHDWFVDHSHMDAEICRYVDRVYPPPPPEYTYGVAIQDPNDSNPDIRRSDGVWGYWLGGEWSRHPLLSDEYIRHRATEIPLEDVECAHIWGVSSPEKFEPNHIRAAIASVLRGEMKEISEQE